MLWHSCYSAANIWMVTSRQIFALLQVTLRETAFDKITLRLFNSNFSGFSVHEEDQDSDQ